MNIYNIAKVAGVSIATVSRVINNSPNVKQQTREKVKAVLREIEYLPNHIARSLATNETKTIGVLTTNVRDSYYAAAIYTIEQELKRFGYNVILCNTGTELKDKRDYLKILLQKKVDGIILVGSVFKEKDNNSHIYNAAASVPVVMLNSFLPGENVYSVVCDDGYGVARVVEWLYKKGHRSFVYLYDVLSFAGISKLEGFREAMATLRLETHPSGIVRVEQSIAGGYKGVEIFIQNEVPYTALIASEDIIAAGAVKKLIEIGKSIPNDVAVFGHNNSNIALCTNPELSSVDNKVETIAVLAARILFQVLNNRETSIKTVILPDLVIRASSSTST
jgi:LacI family transcriptional regulator